MRRCYKIDVVTACLLQGKHHGRQLHIGYFPAHSPVADIKILAKIAQQVTVGEKYGSGTMLADQGRFFTKVRVKTGNPRLIKRLAHTGLFSAGPVDVTSARAKTTGFQSTFSLNCPAFELARAITSHVGRFKISHKQTSVTARCGPAVYGFKSSMEVVIFRFFCPRHGFS